MDLNTSIGLMVILLQICSSYEWNDKAVNPGGPTLDYFLNQYEHNKMRSNINYSNKYPFVIPYVPPGNYRESIITAESNLNNERIDATRPMLPRQNSPALNNVKDVIENDESEVLSPVNYFPYFQQALPQSYEILFPSDRRFGQVPPEMLDAMPQNAYDYYALVDAPNPDIFGEPDLPGFNTYYSLPMMYPYPRSAADTVPLNVHEQVQNKGTLKKTNLRGNMKKCDMICKCRNA